MVLSQSAGAEPPSRKRCTGGRDAGVSDVLGSLLLVALTVLLGASMIVYLLAFYDGPVEELEADFLIRIEWDCSVSPPDAEILIQHVGGEAIAESIVAFYITIGPTPLVPIEGDDLAFEDEGNFDDKLEIGEPWRYPTSLAENTPITFEVIKKQPQGYAIWSGQVNSGKHGCPPP